MRYEQLFHHGFFVHSIQMLIEQALIYHSGILRVQLFINQLVHSEVVAKIWPVQYVK